MIRIIATSLRAKVTIQAFQRSLMTIELIREEPETEDMLSQVPTITLSSTASTKPLTKKLVALESPLRTNSLKTTCLSPASRWEQMRTAASTVSKAATAEAIPLKWSNLPIKKNKIVFMTWPVTSKRPTRSSKVKMK